MDATVPFGTASFPGLGVNLICWLLVETNVKVVVSKTDNQADTIDRAVVFVEILSPRI